MIHKKIKIGISGHKGVLGSHFIKMFGTLKFIPLQVDITKKKQVDNWFIKNHDIDIFIHLASVVSLNKLNKKNCYNVNVIGTKNILNAINKAKVNKLKFFFYSSTSHVYNYKKNSLINEKATPKPFNYYGKTKLLAEKIILKFCKKNKINHSIGRIFSFTSITQKKDYFFPSLIKKLKSNKDTFTIGSSNAIRNFLHIDDVCLAIMHIVKSDLKGIYNICSEENLSIQEVVFRVKENLKSNKKIKLYFDNKINSLKGSNKKIIYSGWKQTKNFNDIIKDYLKYL